ncbi:helix-turn-helix domain-containing protein [Pseudomonas psychrophila]|uniref:helix-turn-helix domain-containing protein n=1 Tax=Pseudomonas psychrophila TaxID=122355 RepID=UPI0002FECA20|nr:helix-turn-helix transcriptional regulator [Pseudomonas psychrophila]
MGIGDRLKEERERLGLNQTELAAVAGASKNSQYNYEKGERAPDAAYLAAVAEKGVDILYVVTGVATPQVVEGFTVAEDKLVNQYRALADADKKAVHRIVGAMWEVSTKLKE